MEIQSIKLLKVLHVALSDRKKKLEEYVINMQRVVNGSNTGNTQIFSEITKFHKNEIKIIDELIGGVNHEIDKSNNNNSAS
jgi:hypothetical protein